jgi:hypothetical protein
MRIFWGTPKDIWGTIIKTDTKGLINSTKTHMKTTENLLRLEFTTMNVAATLERVITFKQALVSK